MKKFIILICLMLVSAITFSQSKTKALPNFTENATYMKYTGLAGDTMNAKMDTLRYTFFVNKDYPVLVYVNTFLNKRVGKDTTVTVHLYGKMFAGQDWTIISSATATSAVVNTNTPLVCSLLTEPSYTGTILYDSTKYSLKAGEYHLYSAATTSGKTAIANYYRYYMVEFVRLLDVAPPLTSTGCKVSSFEIKLFRRYF